MDAESACQYINNIVYKPGWNFYAEPERRFEDAIRLTMSWSAPDYSVENAPDYLEITHPSADFIILCHPDHDEQQLYHQVFHYIMQAEQHEAREAFRIQPTLDAPFHPHRRASMERWGDVQGDLKFGIA